MMDRILTIILCASIILLCSCKEKKAKQDKEKVIIEIPKVAEWKTLMQKVNRRQRQTEKDHAKNAIDNRVKHPVKRLLSIFSLDVFIYRIFEV